MSLTLADRRALETLWKIWDRRNDPLGVISCTDLGEELFARRHEYPRTSRAYARPAGKVLHRLERAGFATRAMSLYSHIDNDLGWRPKRRPHW